MSKKPEFKEEWIIVGNGMSSSGPLEPVKVGNILRKLEEEQIKKAMEPAPEFYSYKPPFELPRSNTAQEMLAAQEEQNRLTREQNQLMRKQSQLLSELSASSKKKDKPVAKEPEVNSWSVKERNKMLAVILAIAMDKYGYNPKAGRNAATGGKAGSIKDGLEKINLEVDEGTIKKYLTEAYEIHKDSIESKKS